MQKNPVDVGLVLVSREDRAALEVHGAAKIFG